MDKEFDPNGMIEFDIINYINPYLMTTLNCCLGQLSYTGSGYYNSKQEDDAQTSEEYNFVTDYENILYECKEKIIELCKSKGIIVKDEINEKFRRK